MNAIQTLHHGLDISAKMTLQLIDDMQDQPLAFPTTNGGNHPLWVLGHMAYVEGQLQGLIFDQPNPLEKWTPIFSGGTEPTANPSDYPSLAEARVAFLELRAETLEHLATLSDADLDRPTKCPPEYSHVVGTVGKCYFIMIANTLTHRGQVADSRRAAGRKRIGM